MADTGSRRVVPRWTAPKGLAAIFLFFVLALFFEFLLIYSFLFFGLIDRNVWVGTFLIPGVNWVLALMISPLFHLLPLTVIVVLVSSWAYLARYTALASAKAEIVKRRLPLAMREHEKRRFRALRQLSKRISRRLQRISRAMKAGLQRIPSVSYISKRLHLARAAVRSAVAVLAVFLALSLLLYIVVYPDMIYRGVIELYLSYSFFRDFVLGTIEVVQGIGKGVPPIGGLGEAINNALIGVAPGFRNSVAQVGASLTGSIVGFDVVGKYVLSQNVAAWASAVVALVYGMYVSSRRGRRR